MNNINTNHKSKRIIHARRINKMRWITGIVMSILVIVITAIALVLSITNYYQEVAEQAGIGTLRMFTTISNIIAAVAAFMCLPFQIDGLKRNRYKLPRWIVYLLYIGAVGVFLTFFIAITVLSITQGFVIIMLSNSNLFMHTINPICITLLFVLIISDVHIKFRISLLSMIPILIYATLYYVMVYATGNWQDYYQANTYIPWPVTALIVLCIAFGASQLLRFLHNRTNLYVNHHLNRYYLESPDYDCPRVSDAVAKLAKEQSKFYYEGDDIDIPTDIIALLSKRYQADKVPIDILYDIYLENYLKSIGKSSDK